MVLFLVLTSCSSTTYHEKEDAINAGPLYESYKRAITNNDPKYIRSFYSSDYFREADANVENFDPSDAVEFMKGWIKTEKSHFEKDNGNDGCLVVNGLDEWSGAGSLAIEYIHEQTGWVIDHVLAIEHDSEEDYFNNAICPTEEELIPDGFEKIQGVTH
ncbi:MAG: hypothetical protein P8X79_23060 [Reinekea sp.]